MPILSKEPCVIMDGTSQRIKVLRLDQSAKEQGRRGKGIMEREDNLCSNQGNSTGDPDMRIGIEEAAREDLMDQTI